MKLVWSQFWWGLKLSMITLDKDRAYLLPTWAQNRCAQLYMFIPYFSMSVMTHIYHQQHFLIRLEIKLVQKFVYFCIYTIKPLIRVYTVYIHARQYCTIHHTTNQNISAERHEALPHFCFAHNNYWCEIVPLTKYSNTLLLSWWVGSIEVFSGTTVIKLINAINIRHIALLIIN